MKQVLRVKSSISGEASVSSRLLDELTAALRRVHGELQLIDRDLEAHPIPHLDSPWLQALSTPAAQRSRDQQDRVAFSDRLIAELQEADILLIGLPMYNFSIPSMLKAWADHVARAGVTFKYSENGPIGLLNGKTAWLVTSMGGQHTVGEDDFTRPYMTHFLNFLGISDVRVITADGLNMGDTHRDRGLATARETIERLLTGHRNTGSRQEVAA